MIALALMAGIVGVGAVRFRILDEGVVVGHMLAKVGLAITILGVIGTTVILAAVAFFNYEPPTLFTSGPDAVNGMAGDDIVMTVIPRGALLVATALVWARSAWRDGVTILFGATWLAVLLVNAVAGFYIELHGDVFQSSAAAKDASFAAAHPITGIFLLPAIAIGLLLVHYYRIEGRARKVAAWAFGAGLAAAVAGTTLWTFADPSKRASRPGSTSPGSRSPTWRSLSRPWRSARRRSTCITVSCRRWRCRPSPNPHWSRFLRRNGCANLGRLEADWL